MSATILWEPYYAERKEEALSCWAPSFFMSQLEEKCYLRLPTSLRETDLPALRALAKTYRDGGGNPVQELVEAIEQHGTITVWPEY